MVTTPEGPAGSAQRDHHHRMLHALRELAAEAVYRASRADELEALLSADEPEDNEDFDL